MAKVAILGAGKIGEALVSALVDGGRETVATVRTAERAEALAARYGIPVLLDNRAAIGGPTLVVIPDKPQDIDALLAEIGEAVSPDQVVLSIVAAITTGLIESR